MKTIYLTLLAISASLISLAQITITYPQNAPAIGSEYDYTVNNDINQSYTSNFVNIEGINQTWDLSEFSGNTNPLVNVSPSEGLDEANFPNADLLETSTNFGLSNTETYYRYEDGNYYIEGNYFYQDGDPINEVARIVYTDDRIFSKYPMTFGDADSDTFGGTFENILAGQNFDRSGAIVIEADGYGSAILPYGTVDNVLRVKVVSNYTDLFFGQQLADYTETQYLWYQEETNAILASYNELYANGSLASKISSYLSEEDFLSINEEYAEAELSIYPNPSADAVNIDFPTSNLYLFTVTDAQGKTVISGDTRDNLYQTMILNALESGIYIFHAFNGNEKYTQKFIIE